jgi:hypothetical protein
MKLFNTIFAVLGLLTLTAAAPVSLGMLALTDRNVYIKYDFDADIPTDLDDFVANAWSRLAAVEDLDPTAPEFRVTDLVRD